MKLVVTGTLGQIGSYLIRDFAMQFPGADIFMIDNMMTHRFPSSFNLPTLALYQFIEADVTRIDLVPLLKDAHVLIHLAANTDDEGSFDKADLLEANNYQATVRVAGACIQTGTRLLTLSSTRVYGTQNEVVSEDCTPEELKLQSPYATSKLKEEQLGAKLCADGSLKVSPCRFGTIFGASVGMRFHTAVNKFCWQAVIGQPITVWSKAYDQKRPYLDLFDAARAIAFIIRKDIFDGRIYNLLTHNATVRQIVDIIRESMPDLCVTFVDNKIMNQLSYEVSCDRFRAEGFNFARDLRRGIGEAINILRNAVTSTC